MSDAKVNFNITDYVTRKEKGLTHIAALSAKNMIVVVYGYDDMGNVTEQQIPMNIDQVKTLREKVIAANEAELARWNELIADLEAVDAPAQPAPPLAPLK